MIRLKDCLYLVGLKKLKPMPTELPSTEKCAVNILSLAAMAAFFFLRVKRLWNDHIFFEVEFYAAIKGFPKRSHFNGSVDATITDITEVKVSIDLTRLIVTFSIYEF